MSNPRAPFANGAPAWADELATRYVEGAASVFLLHGNVHDLVPVDDGREFRSLDDYLATQLFGRRDVVLGYDRGSGVRFLAPGQPTRLARMQEDWDRTLKAIDLVGNTSHATKRSRDPRVVLELLDRYILHKLVEAPSAGREPARESDGESDPVPEATPTRRTSVAILIRYLETIAPAVDASMLSGELGANLIKVLHWANDPGIRGADVTLCLVAESLGEVNRRLVENPFIAKIELDLPDRATRERYAVSVGAKPDTAERIARESNGLTLVGLSQALGGAESDDSRYDRLRRAKKELIEKQCFGLIEFMEPRYDLDALIAPDAIHERLRQDVALFRAGRFDALPMGYLLCGVIGTGKTFTATCLAGSLGIPAVVFKNLRSKWVGSSEGNLQKVLSVVKALGPVVVVIDEADAALGTRAASGDSGTSSRMFAMIASLMSDTHYRGKILWTLVTSRPDLLPVDLKRQGRCEVHIPLFAPETDAARHELFLAMAKKNGVEVASDELPPIPHGLTGADIESLVVQCVRRAAIENEVTLTNPRIEEALAHFQAPDYGAAKELQRLVAIRESTDPGFIPAPLREAHTGPGRRDALERRIHELSQLR